jgi:iron complex outermembrane receptor protein
MPRIPTLLLTTSVLAIAAGGGAAAQQQELEEIIVTAQKRTERLQETPLAVSAVTAEMLEQRGVVDSRNLGTLAPNVTTNYSPSSANTLGIFIRGIGDGEPILTVDAPIGLYVDGVVLGRTTGAIFDLVDLERVEVLRGPQGTLYGRNTVGGAVNFITARPADRFGAEQKFGYGNFRQWQSRTRLDTGELGDTGIRAKLSFVHKQHDGWVDNTLQPDRLKDPGADRVDAGRVALSWDKGGKVRADYSYEASVEHANPDAFQLTALRPDVQATLAASPLLGGTDLLFSPDRRLSRIRLDDDAPVTTRIQGHTLTLQGELGFATLKSLTGFRRWDDSAAQSDLDGNGGLVGLVLDPETFEPGPDPIQRVQLFNGPSNRHQHQWSEELNLVGSVADKLDYVVGAFYFHEKSRELNPQGFTFLVPVEGGIPLGPVTVPDAGLNLMSTINYTHFSTSKAAFGQATWHVTDRFNLTGGLRYTRDTRHLVQQDPIARDLKASFGKTNWAAAADYRITPDVMAYARVASGYRAGGFNARSSGTAAYRPENATTYEAGIKSELWERRVRVNVGGYYTRARDLQVQQFEAGSGGANSNTVNAGKARIAGIEAELQALLGYGFSVDGNFGLVDHKTLQYLVRDPATDSIIDIAGQVHAGGVAKYTANVGLQYDFPDMAAGHLMARLDYSYRSKVRWHPSLFQAEYNEQIAGPGIGLLDGRVTLSQIPAFGAEAALSVWVKNIAGRDYKLWGIDFGALGYAGNTWNPPRTYGVELTARF